MFRKKFPSYRSAKCPLCSEALGTFDSNYLFFSTCNECQIKWAWRPGEEKPIALHYPGKKEPERCECPNCCDRDMRKGH